MKKTYPWLYFIEAVSLFVILIIVSVFYLNQSGMGLFFNSDILGIPNIFKDLANGGHLKDWAIPSTAMFVPDWIIFFISFSLSKSVYFQLLITACLNTLLLYVSIRCIYGQFFSQVQAFIFSLTSLSIFLFLALKNLEPYVFILVPAQHAGAFIVGLFYVFVQMKLIVQPKDSNIINLLLFLAISICLIMGLSDLLFIIQFSLPVLFIYIFMLLKKEINLHKVFVFSFIPFCFSIFGGWLIPLIIHNSKVWTYLNQHSLSIVPISTIKKNAHFIVDSFKFINQLLWIDLIYILFYIGIGLVFLFILFNYIFKKKILINKKNSFFTLFIIVSCILTILSFLSLKIDPTIRYLEPIYFFPILTFCYLGSFLKYNSKILSCLLIAAFFILLYFVLCKSRILYKNIFTLKTNYYPYELSCIDKALQGHDHHGIANYWIARPFSMFSQQGLVINEFFGNLSPFKWNTNVTKVSQSNSYTFVIMNTVPNALATSAIELDQSYVESVNGQSKKIVICGSKKLLIYPKDMFKVAVFAKKGDQYTWPASVLPSQFSNSLVLNQRSVNTKDGPGFVTFGPYVTLSPGIYNVSISYSSKAALDKKIGNWDISPNNTGSVIKFELFGTNNQKIKLNANFTVIHEINENSYEFRIFSSGISNMNVSKIKLIKLSQ